MENEIEFSGRPCANPRCPNEINSLRVDTAIRYCSSCQLDFRNLRKQFPRADIDDLTFLFERGYANLTRVAKLLDKGRCTVRIYRKKGYLRFSPLGKYFVATIDDILQFALKAKNAITMKMAARFLDMPYSRLKKLVRGSFIKPFFIRGRIKYFDKASLSKLGRIVLDWVNTAPQRKSRSHRARSRRTELSTRQIAEILDISVQALWLRMRSGGLRYTLRNGHCFVKKVDLLEFCEKLVQTKHVRRRLKTAAQRYLDSLAAGN